MALVIGLAQAVVAAGCVVIGLTWLLDAHGTGLITLHREEWYCTKSELAAPGTRCIEYVRASGGTR